MKTTDVVTAIIDLHNERDALKHLCGTMLATLAISRNRDRMRDGDQEAIESLIAISDRWAQEFDKITGSNIAAQPRTVP